MHDGEGFDPDEYDEDEVKVVYADSADEAAETRHRDYCSHWGEYEDGQVLVWPILATAKDGILFDVTISHEPIYSARQHKGVDDAQ